MSFPKMPLELLEPKFLQCKDETKWQDLGSSEIEKADGVIFVCPKCYSANDMKRPGVHSVVCWKPRVPQTVKPGPGRWDFKGTGMHDLTLVAGSSSIHLTGPGCGAHFFIENGFVRDA